MVDDEQQELATMVETVRIEKENDELKEATASMQQEVQARRELCEALSAEGLKLMEQRDAAHQQVATLLRQKDATEKSHDEQRTRWSAQLEQASREFETMREQLIPPADLEAMRLQLVEEAAAPWRQRCQDMEAELERMRNTCQSAQLEAQKLKAALEATEACYPPFRTLPCVTAPAPSQAPRRSHHARSDRAFLFQT